MIKRFLALMITMLCIFPASAEECGIFYRIVGGKNEMTVLGSIHVGTAAMYPLNEAIARAVERSDVFVFECDTQSEQALLDTQNLMRYPSGQSVRQHISSGLFKTLKKVAKQSGYSLATFRRLKPWAIVSLLSAHTTSAAMGSADINEALELGVESQIHKMCANKTKQYLETVRQQFEMMDGFSPELQEYLLATACNAVLNPEDIAGMDATISNWPQWWLSGNAEAFASTYIQNITEDPYKELIQEYHDQMVTRRNKEMAEKLALMLESEPNATYFVTIGLLHLVLPNDSVLSELEKMGYQIEAFNQ